jgi:hypothetical protein
VTDKFHEYLYGSKFEVKTDNNPLTYIFDKAKFDAVDHRWVASLSNYNFNLNYRAGKANGDADPLSIIQPETKQMFHNAIKAVCSACVISASNPCIETVLLTQNVNIDDSLVSDVDISAIDWYEEQNADADIRRVKTLFSDWAQTYKIFICLIIPTTFSFDAGSNVTSEKCIIFEDPASKGNVVGMIRQMTTPF